MWKNEQITLKKNHCKVGMVAVTHWLYLRVLRISTLDCPFRKLHRSQRALFLSLSLSPRGLFAGTRDSQKQVYILARGEGRGHAFLIVNGSYAPSGNTSAARVRAIKKRKNEFRCSVQRGKMQDRKEDECFDCWYIRPALPSASLWNYELAAWNNIWRHVRLFAECTGDFTAGEKKSSRNEKPGSSYVGQDRNLCLSK